MACRGERDVLEPRGLNYFEKIGAHHVDCDGDDGGDIGDGGNVEDSHGLPFKLSIHWNVTNACTRTALNTICLVIVADFWFNFWYLRIRFFIFLSYIVWIHGHPPHIETLPKAQLTRRLSSAYHKFLHILDQISSSKSEPSINFNSSSIPTKLKLRNSDQT